MLFFDIVLPIYKSRPSLVKPPAVSGVPCGGLTFPGCLGCGQGARTFWAKSIGWAGPLLGGLDTLPPKVAGPWATSRVARTGKGPKNLILTQCPPVPWNQRCLMIFAQKVLAPGPGIQPPLGGAQFTEAGLSGKPLGRSRTTPRLCLLPRRTHCCSADHRRW